MRCGWWRLTAAWWLVAVTLCGAVAAEELEAPSVAAIEHAQHAEADDPPDKEWSITFDATLNSKYVWRGINLVDDWVFQPAVTMAYGGLTASVWGNMELTNANIYAGHGDTAGDFTEIDYILEYGWSSGRFKFGAGAIHYAFPNTSARSTTELYGSIGLDTLLGPTLTAYQDVDEADGTYLSFSMGHTFADIWKPVEGVAVDLYVCGWLGYGSSNHNRFYYGADKAALTDLLLLLCFPVHCGKGWTVTPAVNFSTLLDEDIRRGVGKDTNVWTGVSVSYAF